MTETFVIGSKAGYSAEIAEILTEGAGLAPQLVDNLDPTSLQLVENAIHSGERKDSNYFAAPGVPGIRKLIADWSSSIGLLPGPAVWHPSASVSKQSHLGLGVTINRLAAVSSGVKLGNHAQLNRSVSVGHDSTLDDFVTVGPGAVLCGNLVVKTGAYIGAGAVICPGVTIGQDAVVGAGAVVLRDIPDGTTWVGNPAKLLRERSGGYKGFSSIH